MEYINVLAAATAAYVFGAIWYMSLSKPWMAAANMSLEDIQGEDGKQSIMPFVIAAISVIVVAAMMRHLFIMAGIEGLNKGALTGFGIGLFMVTPWLATCYAYGMKPRNLLFIDGGYTTFGCTIIGAVLVSF
ncbi:MAG TPA: DUF1761 domain-containing protein [Oceanospirillaceae bacterium]|nr:DUF1761 domain-containing protein [Oceanospirillaceae bacterium]